MYWKYFALSKTGEEITGYEQGLKEEVISRIQTKKLQLIEIRLDFLYSIKKLVKGRRISNRILAEFFEDFKNMLESGINVQEALYAIENSSENKTLQEIVKKIRNNLEEGFSLSEAARETGVFSQLVVNTLKVGETAGILGQVMVDLVTFYRRKDEIKSTLIKSSVYPAVVLCLLFGVMLFVSFRVIPQLESLLPQKALSSFSTRLILGMSFFIQKSWVLVFLVPIILFCLYQFKAFKKDTMLEYYFRLPVIGKLAKHCALAQSFLNLSILTRSGISLIRAFDLIHDGSADNFVTKKLLACRDYVLGGSSFWQALEKDTFFPVLVSYTVRKGEEMGKLDEYLRRVAQVYSKMAQEEIDGFISAIQPVLLGICAGYLILVALAFLVPVYSSLSAVAGGKI